MSQLKAPVRSKWISPSWVEEQLQGLAFKSLYDPFAGQGQVGRYFKRAGKRVLVSDLLEGHYCHLLALVGNNGRYVPSQQIQAWLQVIREPQVATRFGPWAGKWFTPEETIWLGIWNAHLAAPGLDPTERALGAVAVAQVMAYWLGFNRRELGNKPLTPALAFQHYVQTVNTWVFNNGQGNQALRGDAYHLAPKVEADLLFCYPPTDQGFFDYPEPLALFESWIKGNPNLILPGQQGATAGPPTLGLPLATPDAYAEALRRFLARCTHIPHWVLAFNDRYPLDEAAFVALVKEFRPSVRRASMTVATGERGAPPTEKLIIAR